MTGIRSREMNVEDFDGHRLRMGSDSTGPFDETSSDPFFGDDEQRLTLRRSWMTASNLLYVGVCSALIALASSICTAQQVCTLSSGDAAKLKASIGSARQRDGVPAVSIAIVREGKIACLAAYGDAALSNAHSVGRPVTPETRFAIGSVSKEFTAAAILLLADRGRLSLDDKVSKFLPELAGASQVTLRQLLSHTSGYADYFTQEYIPRRTQRPTTVDAILDTWAKRPLAFQPGAEWQYSSTNFVIAGRIVEVVSGQAYGEFLAQNVLRPVGILDATFADHPEEASRNAVGYYRFALGPPRPAPLTGRNWLFAMADLEMTARDVALWDISVINETLLSHDSYQAMATSVITNDGRSTGYGLGLFIRQVPGTDDRQHLLLHHAGEISGFRAHNYIVPDLKSALVVLTNAEYSDVTTKIADQLQEIVGIASPQKSRTTLRSSASGPENQVELRARELIAQLTAGRVNRREFSPDAQEVFTPQTLRDIHNSLTPLGALQRVRLDSTQARGGLKHYAITLVYASRTLQIAEYDQADGHIEQFMIDDGPA